MEAMIITQHNQTFVIYDVFKIYVLKKLKPKYVLITYVINIYISYGYFKFY
jgi:hypothetical protein